MKVPRYTLAMLEQILVESRGSRLGTASRHEAFRLGWNDGLLVGYLTGKIVAYGEGPFELLAAAVRRTLPEDMEVTIGSDEAGKGEWLGPMTVAAVGMTGLQSLELRLAGIMDSKELSTRRRSELEGEIKGNSIWRIVVISPEAFDDLIEKVRSEGKGLNDLLAWAHAKAISEVHSEIAPSQTGNLRVVVDEFDRPKMEERLSKALNTGLIKLIQKRDTEDEMPVVAAGILARQARDTWIESMSEKLKVTLQRLSQEEVLGADYAKRVAKLSYLERTVSSHKGETPFRKRSSTQ